MVVRGGAGRHRPQGLGGVGCRGRERVSHGGFLQLL